MIYSNNPDVMRENIKELSSESSEASAGVLELSGLIGSTPLPEGQTTITGAIATLASGSVRSYTYKASAYTPVTDVSGACVILENSKFDIVLGFVECTFPSSGMGPEGPIAELDLAEGEEAETGFSKVFDGAEITSTSSGTDSNVLGSIVTIDGNLTIKGDSNASSSDLKGKTVRAIYVGIKNKVL